MKSIFKRKTLVALNFLILLGISTRGYTAETPSIEQIGGNVNVTVQGGFTPADQALLTDADTVINTISTRIGTPTDPGTAPTLFGRDRREIELLLGISSMITSPTGIPQININLNEILTLIGTPNPRTGLYQLISNGDTQILTAIAGLVTSIGSTTPPRNLYQVIIDGDTEILTAIAGLRNFIGGLGAPTVPTDTLFVLLYKLIRTIGGFTINGQPSSLSVLIGDPRSHYPDHNTLFGLLRIIQGEVLSLRTGGRHHPSGRGTLDHKLMVLAKSQLKMQDELGLIKGTTARIVEMLEDDQISTSSTSSAENAAQEAARLELLTKGLLVINRKTDGLSQKLGDTGVALIALGQRVSGLESKVEEMIALLKRPRPPRRPAHHHHPASSGSGSSESSSSESRGSVY